MMGQPAACKIDSNGSPSVARSALKIHAADYAGECGRRRPGVTLRPRGTNLLQCLTSNDKVSTKAVDNFVGKLGTRACMARKIGDSGRLLIF